MSSFGSVVLLSEISSIPGFNTNLFLVSGWRG